MKQFEDFTLREYVSVVWRRKWIFIFVALVTLIVGIFMILKLPVLYRSTGVIQVERQKIPEEWISSTVSGYADERIQAISQSLLSNDNLADLIRRYNLLSDADHLTMFQKVEKISGNFTIENRVAQISGTRGSIIIAFSVSYDDPSPFVARDIATEFATLYVTENLKSRTKSVSDTRRFLETESNRLKLELGEIEEKISEFKASNTGVLPEHQALNIQAYDRVEQEIGSIDQQLNALEQRSILLHSSIDSATRYIEVNDQNTATDDPTLERLEQLRTEYMNIQSRYSDVHPDVVSLKREIKILELQLEPVNAVSTTASVDSEILGTQDDAALIQLKTDLESAGNEQNTLRERRRVLLNKLANLEVKINKTPGVEREYSALIRDYESIQNKFNEIRARQSSARISQSLEQEQKGERFSLIQSPLLPDSPYSPNYPKMFVAAFGVSVLIGLGSLFGLEIIEGSVRNIRTLESLTGVPVLATVGYIEGGQDRRRRKRKMILWLLLLASIIAAGIFFTYHTDTSIDSLNFEDIQNMMSSGIDWIRSRLTELKLLGE